MRQTLKFPLAGFLVVAAGLLLMIALLTTNPATANDSPAGAAVFKSKCQTCHGADGSGTAVGKSLNVADLRSAEVQSKPDAELLQAISDGKGNMPGFKGNLTDDEIHAALAHVRTLAKSDSAPKKK
ncbi:MAG: cytochrome c [Terriglobales bacterium]